MRLLRHLLALLVLVAVPGAGLAQPGVVAGRLHQPAPDPTDRLPDFMAVTGAVTSLMQLDRLGRTGTGPPSTQLANKSSLYTRLWLPQGLALTGFFRFEPAPRQDPGDRYLTDHTAWVDALYARWSLGKVSLFSGKIHPRFGLAWANAPGLYGNDIAIDYELREKLGAGVRFWLSDIVQSHRSLGQHNLQVEGFTADSSALSSGLLARRHVVPVTVTNPKTGETTILHRRRFGSDHRMGGADNIDGMGGMVVSLAGVHVQLPAAMGELGYSLGWSSRRAGSDAAATPRSRSEIGLAAGVFHSLPLGPDLNLLSMAEYVRHRASGGFRAADADWLTGTVTLQYSAYTASLTGLRRRRDDPSSLQSFRLAERIIGASVDLGQASGLALLDDLSLAADWRRINDAGRIIQGVGLGVIWGLRF